MFVWKVVDGPYCLEDMPLMERMLGAEEIGFNYWSVVMVTETLESKPFHTEVWFETFNDAYDFAKEVQVPMEPLEISDSNFGEPIE